MTSTDLPALRAFVQRLNLNARIEPFLTYRWDGVEPDTPVLHLEDVSAITFLVDIAGVKEHQNLARLSAKSGDLYATMTPDDPRYEQYCQEQFGLGEVVRLDVHCDMNPRAVAQGCQGEAAFDRIVQTARRSGKLIIHPYMSINEVWNLAANVTREARV